MARPVVLKRDSPAQYYTGEELVDFTEKNLLATRIRDFFSPASDKTIAQYCKDLGLPLDDRLRIAFLTSDGTGCAFYREYTPMKYLKSKYSNEMVVKTFTAITPEILRWCDIAVWERGSTLEPQMIIKQFAHDRIVVAENDDNLLFVPPDNSAYRVYNPTSKEMYLWLQNLAIADAHQVSTEPLRDWLLNYRDHTGLRFDRGPIAVLPNSLHDDDFVPYDSIQLSEKKEVVLGWQGSGAHVKDLSVLNTPVGEIQKQNPSVQFHMFGWNGWVRDSQGHQMTVIPNVRVNYKATFVPPLSFMDTLKRQTYDIELAPLEDYRFNYFKSPLRLLQSGAAGHPAVVSAVGPYRNMPGTIAVPNTPEAWQEGINYLINNPEKRLELAQNAWEHVWDNYRASVNVQKWYEFYMKLRSDLGAKIKNRITE